MPFKNDQSKPRRFKKNAHRPWKQDDLANTVRATIDAEADLLNFDIDLDAVDSESSDTFYPDFNFTDPVLTVPKRSGKSKRELANNTAIIKKNDELVQIRLQQSIQELQLQQQNIMQRLQAKPSSNKLTLGNFFHPNYLKTGISNEANKQMQNLLEELKQGEQKINALTNELKVSSSLEQLEQADIERKAEAHSRFVAEQRMREALQQAETAAEQFKVVMSQANKAIMAQQEEEQLRKLSQAQAKEAIARANEIEIALQNERLARIAAEHKADLAITQREQLDQITQALQEANDKVTKTEQRKLHEEREKIRLQQELDILQDKFTALDIAHSKCHTIIKSHEVRFEELTEQHGHCEKKITEFNAQRDKLKSLVLAEQELRRSVENKLQTAITRAEKAEKELAAGKKQAHAIEERAKRAIAHANQTVMQLLNNSMGEEDALKLAIEPFSLDHNGIKATQDPISSKEEYTDEDLKF